MARSEGAAGEEHRPETGRHKILQHADVGGFATACQTPSFRTCMPTLRLAAANPPPTRFRLSQVTNVTNWKECLNNNAAWDTLTWFAALIAMAAALNKYGFIPWLSTSVVNIVGGLGLGWQVRQCGRVAAGRWRGKQDTGL